MSVETWYRGEGLNVVPAKAQGVENDIGDGMYLTDKLEVAESYAKDRAPKVDDRRVFKVSIGSGDMKILDLTKDPRWKKHMNFPMPPNDSSGVWSTPDTKMRQFPSSGIYKQHFQNFLTNNNINLNDYDAVIGDEYRSGGKQLCILYKNGQPSPIQQRLRLKFTPIGFVATPKSPSGTLVFGGKIGPGLKFIGGTLITIAITIILGWVFNKLSKDDIEMQFKELQPKIESDINAQKQKSLGFLVDGKKAFATVNLSLSSHYHADTGPDGAGGLLETMPVLRYQSLEITDHEVIKAETTDFQDFPGGVSLKKIFKMISIPLTYSQQEVELYRSYLNDLSWYDEQLKISPSAQDTDRLSKDKKALLEQLQGALK